MSEEEKIESMRYELGRDSAQKGEPLHKGSSEEFYHGYTDVNRSAWAGSSNVMPKNFGKGGTMRPDPWECICGNLNRRWYRHCQQCGISFNLSILAEKADPVSGSEQGS